MSYKWWLLLAAFLFGIGLVLGLATSATITGLLAEDIAALEQLAESLRPLPQPVVLVVIFVKNVLVLVISFVFSPVFCLVPVVALFLNGWLLGVVATRVVEEKSLGYLLGALLPHGIIELPALILGEAVAFSFGSAVVLALFKKDRRRKLLPNLRKNLKYLTLAIALLLPAAIIETYITPLFLPR